MPAACQARAWSGVTSSGLASSVTSMRNAEQRTEFAKESCNGVQWEERGGTTTEVQGIQIGYACHSCFLENGLNILPRWRSLPYSDREIAVGTASNAEWDMNVEMTHGEKLNGRRLFRAPTSAFRV